MPKGHQVQLSDIESPGGFLGGAMRLTVAIDVTAGTFSLPYDALHDLKHCTGTWNVISKYDGEVVGSAVSMKESRETNAAWTRLFLTP